MDIESRIQQLKSRVTENPDIATKEIEQEVRELMLLGVRCRRFSDEVGLSNYVIYKIRKVAGISQPPRPHKKFREVRLVGDTLAKIAAPTITVKVSREKGGLTITGEQSEVLALVKGIL